MISAWLLGPAAGHAYTLKTTESGMLVRWHSTEIELRLAPSAERMLPRDEMRAALRMAVDAWRGLPGVPRVHIAPGEPAEMGHDPAAGPTNGVYVVEPWPFDIERLAVTVTTYEADSGRMLDADVLVNGEALFALLSESRDARLDHYDIGSVLTHEMGHVLGLDESEEQWATMWPHIGRGQTHQRSLETDDEEGIIAIYYDAGMAPMAAEPHGGCGGAHVGGPIDHGRGTLIGMLGLILVLLWARRPHSPWS